MIDYWRNLEEIIKEDFGVRNLKVKYSKRRIF